MASSVFEISAIEGWRIISNRSGTKVQPAPLALGAPGRLPSHGLPGAGLGVRAGTQSLPAVFGFRDPRSPTGRGARLARPRQSSIAGRPVLQHLPLGTIPYLFHNES